MCSFYPSIITSYVPYVHSIYNIVNNIVRILIITSPLFIIYMPNSVIYVLLICMFHILPNLVQSILYITFPVSYIFPKRLMYSLWIISPIHEHISTYHAPHFIPYVSLISPIYHALNIHYKYRELGQQFHFILPLVLST